MSNRILQRRTASLMLVVLVLVACGGAQAEPTDVSVPTTARPTPTDIPVVAEPTSTTESGSTQELPQYWPTEGWRTSTPEQQGMDSEKLAEAMTFIQDPPLYDIDSVTVIRNGYVVLDATFSSLYPDYKPNVQGVAKGILSALVGIAIDKGYIEGVHQPVLEFFPERTIENLSRDKQAITLEHLLTNSTGLACRDSYRYDHQGLISMMSSSDWVQYILDLPMAEEPGTRFEYCNGASLVLSAIIQETIGMSAFEFAQEHLFHPLGISDVDWPSNGQGITIGWGDLRIRPHDLAKIGHLYLSEGLWDGEQVVSSEWVEVSTRKHIFAGTVQNGYGYLWWVSRSGIPMVTGATGKQLFLVPEKELVVVFTADLPDAQFTVPETILKTRIIPAAKSTAPLPANPDGVARLQALVQSAAEEP